MHVHIELIVSVRIAMNGINLDENVQVISTCTSTCISGSLVVLVQVLASRDRMCVCISFKLGVSVLPVPGTSSIPHRLFHS